MKKVNLPQSGRGRSAETGVKSAATPEQTSDVEAYQKGLAVLAEMGIHPIPSRGGIVTNELVRRLLGDQGF